MDYEKAVDFINRALLLEKMMQKGIGHKFANAVYNSYKNTSYLPKLTNTYTGAVIETDYGGTQGKTSSDMYQIWQKTQNQKICQNARQV